MISLTVLIDKVLIKIDIFLQDNYLYNYSEKRVICRQPAPAM
ncbi:Hypothetical protein ETEE_3559 [Edwardsiella anguillarum ET080813]|uniref:Uncharacterized protein n=1 Tax=Edwardsiella anguillarum ET080813 TaxID=667120 RepID=A0A076LX01_9GAMM|nr:Hypothetical protein ETEE_3559 [Edwardsiella anguillarum ET080813]